MLHELDGLLRPRRLICTWAGTVPLNKNENLGHVRIISSILWKLLRQFEIGFLKMMEYTNYYHL